MNFKKIGDTNFEEIISRSVFVELQLMQILINFQTFFNDLKIGGLGAKLCVAFLLF